MRGNSGNLLLAHFFLSVKTNRRPSHQHQPAATSLADARRAAAFDEEALSASSVSARLRLEVIKQTLLGSFFL